MLQLFADLKLRWKIALPISLLAALLICMGLLSMQGISQVADASTRLTNRHLPAISLLLNADRDLYQAFVAERSLLDEGAKEHAAELRAAHAENIQQAYDRVRKYADMQPSSEALALVAEFERNFAQWKATSGKVLQLADTDPAAASRTSHSDSEAQFGAMRDPIDKLGELEDTLANSEGADAISLSYKRSQQQALIIVIGLLICAVLTFGFPLLVVRPLHNLLRRIEQIADGDGDLRERLDVQSRDELGALSQAFNRFLDTLQPLIKEVSRVTGEVAGSAEHLAGMAEANSRLINSEHAAVDLVSAAATEISAAVHEVARNAQNAADAARSAKSQSHEGAQVTNATIHAIRQLALELENTSDTVQTLEQETGNIGAVLAVIKSIAEQTNLLALNAAIEAARAGEQGRGFAVVADEVRALAARTQDATKDIQQMIERLQGGVQNAVKAMHSGSAKARDSVEQAAGVDTVLSATGDSVACINDMAAQIATACEEQSCATEEIARNISDIRELSNEAARTSEQSTRASVNLSALSQNLAQLVGRFRA
nr:methyl-accepting chemotaxis protein [uncultured Pseudomonas sp.]